MLQPSALGFLNGLAPGLGNAVSAFGSVLPQARPVMMAPQINPQLLAMLAARQQQPMLGQFGPVASPFGMFGGGQVVPGGFQAGPIAGRPPQGFPSFPQGPAQFGPAQINTPINFRPVIVQNQFNSLPLRASGGINATQIASANLNVNGVPFA